MIGEDGSESLATLHTFSVVKSVHYEIKFRVRNQVGWSDFSPVASFIAADTPSEPTAPELISFSSTQISLSFNLASVDNGGLPIVSYTLEITDNVLTGFTPVVGYTGEPDYDLTIADGLVEGAIYTIRWFASNSKGEGTRSDEILVSLMDTPLAPTSLSKVTELSS